MGTHSLRYADVLKQRMAERGTTMRQLAASVGKSYEHIRRILNGEPAASKAVNAAICKALKLDSEDMWRLAVGEKTERRFGTVIAPQIDPPRDREMAKLWPKLSHADRERLLRIAEGLVLARQAESL